ncbi:MAG: magnesium/cobalt transporter CorA, partial [Planctomycetaceae bacterium]|nr:magnesium/cobalt transporter CorA [Planctomycetaceae bacterium]
MSLPARYDTCLFPGTKQASFSEIIAIMKSKASGSRRAGHRRRFFRRVQPGEIPGFLVPEANAVSPIVREVCYNDHTLQEVTVEKPLEWSPTLNADTVTWVDVDGLGDTAVIARIGELFGLHPLALEDVVNVHQRPKVEMYGDRLFLVVRAHSDHQNGESEQVALFLGPGFVVTFQESGVDCFAGIRARLQSGRGRIRQTGADYLLYSLLDNIIDQYFPILEAYGEELDSLDAALSGMKSPHAVHRIHKLRHRLADVRRSVWPLRDVVNGLIRDSGELITDETDVYLRDCYDHTIQLIDVLETDRELCADLRDLHMTMVSNRMNEIMKLLTIISTIFIPLSFITGLYGMNFNRDVSPWNMPELNWRYGYPMS